MSGRWPERVPNPLQLQLPVIVPIDTDNVETANVLPETRVPGQEQQCCTGQLSLFASIDGQYCVDKAVRIAAADLDENEAFIVEHDKVDFAATAAKIPGDRREAVADQVLQRLLLRAVA